MRDWNAILHQVGAASARVGAADGGFVEVHGAGGGLASTLEKRGAAGLGRLLSEGESMALTDGALTVTVVRRRWEALVRATFPNGQVMDELVALPAASPGRPIADVVEALHDPTLPLRQDAAGRWEEHPADPVTIPPVPPGTLGASTFRERHGLRAAYVAGPIAYGVTGPAFVSALARSHLLGFYGTGGLDPDSVIEGLATLAAEAGGAPAGVALPAHSDDRRMAELVLVQSRLLDLRRVLAWATAPPSPDLVRFRASGLRRMPDGRVMVRNRLFVQVNNPDAAEPWMRPPPGEILDVLVGRGQITVPEAALARRLPVAEDVIAESPPGARAERWPLFALLPSLQRLRARLAEEEGYGGRGVTVHLGAAGELGDPATVHAAFHLGADFVVTGTINQTTVEAATSLRAKELLAEASVSDCRGAPGADRFEVGGRVQVLSRGTRFAQQAERLYDLYRRYPSLADIPADERAQVEKSVFHRPLGELWDELLADLRERRPEEAELALEDARHQMALIFKWYLDRSARWAVSGTPGRRRDYQIWCSPAMGLFNDWVSGTWLQPLVARRAVAVADALLRGAAVLARVRLAGDRGVALPAGVDQPPPSI